MLIKIRSYFYAFYHHFKFSLFNVWRNRNRTIITLTSIMIGTITLILINGYIEVISTGLRNDAIQKQFGHIQIAEKGYFEGDENSTDHMMDFDQAQKLQSEIMNLNQIDIVNMRLNISGIIGNSKKSTVFMGIAGLTEYENLMAPSLIEGRLLSDNDPNGVLIGQNMAEKLNAKIGDKLIIFVNSESGSQEAILVTVRGIYKAIMKEQEKVYIYLTLNAGWKLLLEKKVHKLLIIFSGKPNEKQFNEIKNKIQQILDSHGSSYEIRDWKKLAAFIMQVIGLFKGMSLVLGIIVFVVILFNIQNTMHMSIVERFREIGTIRAMGGSRAEIIRNFLTEGLLIGLMGAILGICISLILATILNNANLSLPPGPGQDKPTPVRFDITLLVIINAGLINLFIAIIASYFPARKGAKIKIIDALKYN